MFCPELIASLSFTPVAAGVILLPDLMVIHYCQVQILRKDTLLTTLKKRIWWVIGMPFVGQESVNKKWDGLTKSQTISFQEEEEKNE